MVLGVNTHGGKSVSVALTDKQRTHHLHARLKDLLENPAPHPRTLNLEEELRALEKENQRLRERLHRLLRG